MAAGNDSKTFSHSVLNAADEYFDINCTPCGQSNKNKGAVKYCVSCKEYFCVACVKNHNSFKLLSTHKLVDPQVAANASGSSSVKYIAVPTELCKIHQMKLVDMYCAEDDVVGCSVCFSLGHSLCGDKHYVPEYTGAHVPQKRVKQVSKQLTTAIESMNSLKKDQAKLDTNVDKSKAECKKEVKNYRADINTILDQIEATTLSEIDTRHGDIKMNIGAKIQNIQDILNELVRIKSEIESDQCNEAQRFVLTKLSQILLAQVEHLQSSESNKAQTDELSFSRNAEIMTFLLNIVSLGALNPSMTHRNSAEITDPQSQEQTQKQYTMDDKRSLQQPTKFTMSTKQIDSEQPNKTDGSTESSTQQQQKSVVSTKFTASTQQIDTEQPHTTASLTKSSAQQTKTTGLIKSGQQKLQPRTILANTGEQQQQHKSPRTPLVLDSTRDKDQVTTKENETTTQKQKLYKILRKSEYNIQEPDDGNTCAIFSSCMLQNGNTVLADFDNNKLKLIDNHKYHVISSLKLDNAPMSVCEVNEGEIAVCMFISRKIVFVSVCDDKLTFVRGLSMDHVCRCITVMGDKMYICDRETVYFYTLSGERLNTICKERSGLFSFMSSNIFSNIQDITASENGRMLHVADRDKGLITISTDGKVVWRFTGTELRGARGVCTDGGQSLFVCGYLSDNVIQLSENENFMGEIVLRKDGLYGPQTIRYSRNNNTLVIGQEDNNNITVLTLTN